MGEITFSQVRVEGENWINGKDLCEKIHKINEGSTCNIVVVLWVKLFL